jgi:hypothetical protein
MNTTFWTELSDDSAQNVSGGYFFGGNVNTTIKETLDIKKTLVSKVTVIGKFAGAEASAEAYGANTSTQAISNTYTGALGSASDATSISATGGSSFTWAH